MAFLPEVASDDRERGLGRLPGKCLSVQNSKQRFSSGTPLSRGKDEEKNKMAANVVADAAREAAFMAFEAEFTRNG